MVRYQAPDVYGQMLARSEEDTAELARWVTAYRAARKVLAPEEARMAADRAVQEPEKQFIWGRGPKEDRGALRPLGDEQRRYG